MKQTILGAVCAGIFVVASSSASATVIIINSNVPDGQYADIGFTGQFDITPYMSSPTYNAPYIINSAIIDFSFSDNSDALTLTESSSTMYYYVDPAESVSLNLSGESASGATTYFSNTTVVGETVYSAYSCGPFDTDTCYTYGPLYQNDSGYNGSFNIMQALTGSGLAAILSTGILNFTGNVTGSLVLNYATLTIDATPNPVPVPATAWLLGSGLLGLVGVARRKTA